MTVYDNNSVQKDGLLLYGLGFLMLSFTFIDFVRRFFTDNRLLLLYLDAAVVLVYFIYFLIIRQGKISLCINRELVPAFIFLLLLLMWTTLELINMAYPSMTLSLAGYRTYWLAVPMMAIGYYVAKEFELFHYEYIYRCLFLLAVIVIAFSALQAVLDRGQYTGVLARILSPMGHEIHSYGQEVHELTSSFFASSKRYGKYLLFCYMMLWGINKLRKKSNSMLFLIFAIGLYVAGSREALWIFIAFHVAYYLVMSEKRIKYTLMASGLAATVTLVLVLGLYVAGFEDSQRVVFLAAYGESVLDRILLMLPFTNIIGDNEYIAYGVGLGRYGAEALLVPGIAEQTNSLDVAFFYPHEYFRSAISFADSGLTKIVVELGIVGMILYLCLITSFIVIGVRGFLEIRTNSMAGAAGFWILAWVFFFLKAHVTVSDIMLSVFLYGAVGFVAGRRRGVKYEHASSRSLVLT